jgi:hypothetical protein
MLWLLIVLATIISFLSIFLSLRLVKKFDEFELITSNAIEILNNERINLLKQVEILYRRGRILNNETKENNRKRNK